VTERVWFPPLPWPPRVSQNRATKKGGRREQRREVIRGRGGEKRISQRSKQRTISKRVVFHRRHGIVEATVVRAEGKGRCQFNPVKSDFDHSCYHRELSRDFHYMDCIAGRGKASRRCWKNKGKPWNKSLCSGYNGMTTLGIFHARPSSPHRGRLVRSL
jgi:hypothetical protein